MKRIQTFTRLFFVVLVFALTPIAVAHADSLNIVYYTISSSDPDANALSGGVIANEVQSGLGPDGLPLLNTSAYGPTSGNSFAVPGFPIGTAQNTPFNVNVVSASNPEITYWDPTLNHYVTETGTGTVPLPINLGSNFFPPDGTGNGDGGNNGYQAAYLYGELIAGSTESVSFTVGSDDMAFVYLDGQIVCDDGGVHGSSGVACSTPTISAGAHSLQIFFVDINTVQSGLTFSLQTQDVTIASTPEPSSLLLLGSGFLILALVLRKKQLGVN